MKHFKIPVISITVVQCQVSLVNSVSSAVEESHIQDMLPSWGPFTRKFPLSIYPTAEDGQIAETAKKVNVNMNFLTW